MNLSDLKRNKSFLLSALGVSIQPSGKALCPFHSEDTPSLHVWNSGGNWFFKCHGCDAHGTVIDAFMLKYKLDSVFEAMKQMESDLGVKIIEDESAVEPVIDQDRANNLIERAHKNLMESFDIQEQFVFKKRGFRSLDVMEKYRIGFLVDAVFKGWEGWTKFTCWVIPIRRADGLIMGVKLHNEMKIRSAEDAKIPKCLWAPLGTYPARDTVKGIKPRNGTAMLWPPPESFKVDEIYLCPGELKALGMEDNGFPATAITQGESGPLPEKILNTIRRSSIGTWIGMRDEDETGNSWINGKELANGKKKKGIKEQIESCGKVFYSISLCKEYREIEKTNFKSTREGAGSLGKVHEFGGQQSKSCMAGRIQRTKNDDIAFIQASSEAKLFSSSFAESLKTTRELESIDVEDQDKNLLLSKLQGANMDVSERDSIEVLRQAESVLEATQRESQHGEVHSDWIETLRQNQESFKLHRGIKNEK